MTGAGDSDPVPLPADLAALLASPSRLLPEPSDAAAGGDHAAGVALVVQQRRVGLALLRAARRRRFGLRAALNAADEAAPRLPRLLQLLCADAGTRVIALCLDVIEDGAALRAALAAARRTGRFVVSLHATAAAEAEAQLAPGISSQHVRDALLEAEGVIAAGSHRELLDIALHLDSLGRTGLPKGRGVAILTGGGGGGVIAADLCGQHGLSVPALSAETRAALVPLVPAIASTANPVDLTPEMFNEKFYDRFPLVLDVVAADPAIDAVFLPTTFNAPRGNAVAAQVLSEFHARSPKPVLIAAGGHAEMAPIFAAHGVAPISDTADAAAALARLMARGAFQAPPTAEVAAVASVTWPDDPVAAKAALPRLLAEAGFDVTLPLPVETSTEALRAAALVFGFPLALSALPCAGRREIGDICDAQDLEAARMRLLGQHGITGLALRRELPGVLPLRILGFRDPAFGPVLALGAGGVQARVLDDLVLVPAPFDTAAALDLLGRSRAAAHAQRMDRSVAIEATARAIARLSQLVAAVPWPRFLLQLDPVALRGGAVQVLGATFSATGTPG